MASERVQALRSLVPTIDHEHPASPRGITPSIGTFTNQRDHSLSDREQIETLSPDVDRSSFVALDGKVDDPSSTGADENAPTDDAEPLPALPLQRRPRSTPRSHGPAAPK